MSTPLVISVTDELVEQLSALTCRDEGGAVLIHADQVRALLAERAELLRDAERYAFVKTMPAEMLLAWRGMYGFADEAIDAAMQSEAKP